jgi:hypothetical protein
MKDGLTHIRIRGAREHNLKGVNVDIPRNELVVITGCRRPAALRGVALSLCASVSGTDAEA